MAPVTNKTTDAGLSEEQMVFYSRALLSRLLPNLVWPMFGQPRPMPTKAGQSVNWRGFDPLPAATTPLSEGVTPDGSPLTVFNLSATPKQYGDYVKITDLVDLTSFDPVLTETAQLLGEQAAETYDLLVRDVVSAGTNVQYVGTNHTATADVTATDKISLAEIQKVVRTFHTNKIKPITGMVNASTGVGTTPIAAAFVGICSPSTAHDLKGVTGFTPVHEYASTVALLPNEIGSLDEVRFVRSDNPKIKAGEGAAGIDVHCTVIFGQGAFGIVSLAGVENIVKGFGSGDDPLNQRMTSGWKAMFTAVILQQLAICRLEHAVSA